ncbi:hypothetical protein H7U20_24905, partial [Rugamonas sp. CCM 8940]
MQKQMTKLIRLFSHQIACDLFRRCLPRRGRSLLAGILLLWGESLTLAQPIDGAADHTSGSPLSALFAPQPAVQPGQSATQMPDGRWLLLGGQGRDYAPTPTASMLDVKTGGVIPLVATLGQPRSGHTATLLPDGTVLILGGVDAAGAILTSAEQFDPATGQVRVLDDPVLIPRWGHTATVLSNGHLFISGGVDQHGHAIYDAEIYDPLTRKTDPFSSKLGTARMKHIAAMLPSADVLLWGGVNMAREALSNGELYERSSERFSPVDSAAALELSQTIAIAGTPGIRDSRPAAEGQSAAIDQPLMVHFAQRMAVATLTTDSVTLIGPYGAVPVKVVPVEYGMLLFVTPLQDLLPASRYTLFINGATGASGQPLALSAIGFDTVQLGAKSTSSFDASEDQGSVRAMSPATSSGDAVRAASTTAGIVPPTRLGSHELQAVAAANGLFGAEAWLPDASHFSGDWRARRAASPLQGLPPLQGAEGETALSGQVLTLHGRPLENVTLTIAGQSARSDATGRFLLPHLVPGAQVLSIDGQSAGVDGKRYGYYQVRVDVEKNRTTVLPYTIWSTKLDPAGSVALPSPTLRETVVTSPRIPGLELRIPAGTIIRDRNGKIVTEINMTAIPTDRPPFPIPDLGVPVYFTIQPGGAKLSNLSGMAQQGARLIYPNFSGAAPGTRIDFWNYDTLSKGWYVYGRGTVMANGKQVMPDAGVAIYEFTGAMVSLPSNAPAKGPTPNGCGAGTGGGAGSDDCNADPNQPAQPAGCAGDPVDCATGLFLQTNTDLFVDGVVPLKVGRSYRQLDPASRAFGIGSSLSYDFYMVGDVAPYTYQDLILPDGGRVHYVRTSAGTGFVNAVYQHMSTTSKYFGSTIKSTLGHWELRLKDGTVFVFPDAGYNAVARLGAVRSIRDRYGNTTTLDRDGKGNLIRVTSPGSRYLQFTYDEKNRITVASDNMGRTVRYEYDTIGRLIKVIDPDGQFEAYTYDDNHNMLTVQDKRGNLMVTNVYDVNNRVSKQTYGDGSTNQFAYKLDVSGKVTQTDVTDERGTLTRMMFNAGGYTSSMTKAFGLPEQQAFTYERDPATNLLLSVTDALGRKTAYAYDAMGNLLTQTVLAGGADAVTSSRTYTADFSRLASVTDFLGNQLLMRYDAKGQLTELQDRNGNRVKRNYNAAGQPLQITDALGNSSNFAYDGFDLAQASDPLGRSVQFFNDNAGRRRGVVDALGNHTVYDLDALDRLSQVTDTLGQSITSGYDANGNPVSVTDPKGNRHQFAFDQRNAPTESTDPLNQLEAYVYDGKHNLIQKTDRKRQVTRYTYDALDRLTSTTYADGASVRVSYDQANRVTRIDDSINGAITFRYDGRDRVTQATTPRGTVAYTYDANGRRQSMDVAGQPTLRYSYDAGGRLTRIVQDAGPANNNQAQGIRFAYDAADRRIQTSYANGIVRRNSFDAAGQLTAIVYINPDGSTLGDLSYTYDNGGRRIEAGGSLARTALPAALSGARVDAANRLSAAGVQQFSYDANGNLT